MNIKRVNQLLKQLTEAITSPILPPQPLGIVSRAWPIQSLGKSRCSEAPASKICPEDFEAMLPSLVVEYMNMLADYEADCKRMGMPDLYIDKYEIGGRVEGEVTTQEELYWFLMGRLGKENFTQDFYLRFVTELEKNGIKVITRRPIGVYRRCPSYTTGL